MESVLLQNMVEYDIQMWFSSESFGHWQFQSVMQFLMDHPLACWYSAEQILCNNAFERIWRNRMQHVFKNDFNILHPTFSNYLKLKLSMLNWPYSDQTWKWNLYRFVEFVLSALFATQQNLCSELFQYLGACCIVVLADFDVQRSCCRKFVHWFFSCFKRTNSSHRMKLNQMKAANTAMIYCMHTFYRL